MSAIPSDYPYGVREEEGVNDAAPAILHVDPLIEVNHARQQLVAEQRPGLSQGALGGGRVVRQIPPVRVEENVLAIPKVKKVERHASLALAERGAQQR
jgi:hypothetical protein